MKKIYFVTVIIISLFIPLYIIPSYDGDQTSAHRKERQKKILSIIQSQHEQKTRFLALTELTKKKKFSKSIKRFLDTYILGIVLCSTNEYLTTLTVINAFPV
jgi:hypothetical protein